MNHPLLLIIFLVACLASSRATTLTVGPQKQYADPRLACLQAKPGDTVLMFPAQYRGTFWIENLNGTADAPIVIRGTDRAGVVFDGGSESMHFSECSHLIIENFSVRGQTGNGMNCDDAGTFDTPTHHITFRGITFGTMGATGNNDQLKLSGLDDFVVEDCIFEDGAAGGSGTDMVGCHRGVFRNNMFRRLGSNCIQAKGGTQFIRIERNTFVDGGERALNLGGSTGLAFFRPQDARFEAADLTVVANLFVRSVTPIAFVGSVRVTVTNNTIIDPQRWVFRILQETVDTSRFAPCGNNTFQNNVVVFRSTISRHVNIGANTAPSSFTLRNNLWYNVDAPNSSRPQEAQLTEASSLYGRDPLLRGYTTGDYRPQASSPVKGAGIATVEAKKDLVGRAYANPPSIGAYEADETTAVDEALASPFVRTVRTPEGWWLTVPADVLPVNIRIVDLRGAARGCVTLESASTFVPTSVSEFVIVDP
ncbi:MAG: right-handed parallel beta-helix repeat-containing protein [Candidatus Kapaibacterium sp.]